MNDDAVAVSSTAGWHPAVLGADLFPFPRRILSASTTLQVSTKRFTFTHMLTLLLQPGNIVNDGEFASVSDPPFPASTSCKLILIFSALQQECDRTDVDHMSQAPAMSWHVLRSNTSYSTRSRLVGARRRPLAASLCFSSSSDAQQLNYNILRARCRRMRPACSRFRPRNAFLNELGA